MTATIDNVARWLIECTLISQADVIEHGVEIREVSRRNANLQVSFLHEPRGLFVKQPNPTEPGSQFTLAHEAVFYHRLAPLLGRAVPRRVAAFDGALVLELVCGAKTLREDLADLTTRTAASPIELVELGATLGATLREVHAILRASPDTDAILEALPPRPPWILELHRPSPQALPRLSPANVHLIRLLQQQPGAMVVLDQLRSSWRTDAVIHADIKADNLLVTRPTNRPAITIVDWELVQHGDRWWDVGSVLHELLLSWVFSMPMGASPLEALIAQAKLPLAIVGEIARAFWTAYSADTDDDAGELLIRTIRFAGARLLQSVYEFGRDTDVMSNHTIAIAQLAINLLEDPREACTLLLGLYAPVLLAPHHEG